ncbi:MAG: SIMPL domain-containing protein [archaeon]|nr:SIMPL domain-containing protein [archaeon]
MIKRKLLWNLGIGLVGIFLLLGIYYFYTSGAEVSANGSSVVKAQPDLMSVYINIDSGILSSAELAQNKVSETLDKFLVELSSSGIEEKDIELSNYQVYPEYDWASGKQSLRGYRATQQLIINLEVFDRVALVIDGASNSGALVSGINYELSSVNQNKYKAQALNEASRDARIKASSIADGFGKNLGRLVSVQSQDFNYYPYPLYSRTDVSVGNAEAEKAVVSVSSRDLEVSASVSATYTMTKF